MDLKPDRSLRHEQDRLLLLHDAAVSLPCVETKKLIPHCENTPNMLVHYQTCTTLHCSVCGQVRGQTRQSKEGESLKQEGLTGGWQSDKDIYERKMVVVKIANVLQRGAVGGASQEWLHKLPKLAAKLEAVLYWSANSPCQYKDTLKLLLRLKELVRSIKRHQRAQQTSEQRNSPVTRQATQVLQPPTQLQLFLYQEHFRGPQEEQKAMMQNRQQLYNQAHQPQMIHPLPPVPGLSIPNTSTRYVSKATATSKADSQGAANHQKKRKTVSFPPSTFVSTNAAKSRSASSSRKRSVEDRRRLIWHTQQRLLLLHHAAKCQQEIGRCTVTPHCAAMKKLWDHVKRCKHATTCTVKHCISSRRILCHYRKCKDVKCHTCMPVRTAICRDTLTRNAIEQSSKHQGPLVQQNQMASESQVNISATTSSTFGLPNEADPVAFSSTTEPSPKRFKETKG